MEYEIHIVKIPRNHFISRSIYSNKTVYITLLEHSLSQFLCCIIIVKFCSLRAHEGILGVMQGIWGIASKQTYACLVISKYSDQCCHVVDKVHRFMKFLRSL